MSIKELETKKEVKNLRKVDQYLKRRTGLSNSHIHGQNNKSVQGTSIGSGIEINIPKNLKK